MDIREFENILIILERLTQILEQETFHVRKRDLVNHQDLIDEKGKLLARLSLYQSEYSRQDFENLVTTPAHRERYDKVRADFGKAFKENGMALAAANKLYDMLIDTINQAIYEAQDKPIGYTNDHGQFRSGKNVYTRTGGAAMKFSEQF